MSRPSWGLPDPIASILGPAVDPASGKLLVRGGQQPGGELRGQEAPGEVGLGDGVVRGGAGRRGGGHGGQATRCLSQTAAGWWRFTDSQMSSATSTLQDSPQEHFTMMCLPLRTGQCLPASCW